MSDDLDTDVADQPDSNPNIRILREKADKVDAAEARAAQAERELAFARAGIPLNDPRSSYFLKGYAGENTPEAIQAEWNTHFGQGPAQPQIPASEVEAHQRIAQAAEGAGVPPVPTHEEELTAKVRSGELKSADDIAHYLHQRTPDMVSWDGPADASFSPLR